MSYYARAEMAVFVVLAAALFVVFPQDTLAAYLAVVVAYASLQAASALAFCIAIRKGFVQELSPAPYTYSVSREGQVHWLVMRHIWTYLPGRVRDPKT